MIQQYNRYMFSKQTSRKCNLSSVVHLTTQPVKVKLVKLKGTILHITVITVCYVCKNLHAFLHNHNDFEGMIDFLEDAAEFLCDT